MYIFLAIVGVLVFVGLIVYGIVRSRQFTPEGKGKSGEEQVARILGETVAGQKYVLNNLIFSCGKGSSCQIDHILINEFGIWVIETKNYSGTIYGNKDAQEWTQYLGSENHKFYNPVKQNATHIYRLSQRMGVKGIFHNIVVFTSNADILNVSADGVYPLIMLAYAVTTDRGVHLTAEQMETYYNRILKVRDTCSITAEEHLNNVLSAREKIENGICPRCGGKLKLRTGEYGEFYGCVNYPNCKFTKNIGNNL